MLGSLWASPPSAAGWRSCLLWLIYPNTSQDLDLLGLNRYLWNEQGSEPIIQKEGEPHTLQASTYGSHSPPSWNMSPEYSYFSMIALRGEFVSFSAFMEWVLQPFSFPYRCLLCLPSSGLILIIVWPSYELTIFLHPLMSYSDSDSAEILWSLTMMTCGHYSTASLPLSPLWFSLGKTLTLVEYTPLSTLNSHLHKWMCLPKTSNLCCLTWNLRLSTSSGSLSCLEILLYFPGLVPVLPHFFSSISWPPDLLLPHPHSQMEITAFYFTEQAEETRREHLHFPTISSDFLSQCPDSLSPLVLCWINCPSDNRPGSRETKAVAADAMEDMI